MNPTVTAVPRDSQANIAKAVRCEIWLRIEQVLENQTLERPRENNSNKLVVVKIIIVLTNVPTTVSYISDIDKSDN